MGVQRCTKVSIVVTGSFTFAASRRTMYDSEVSLATVLVSWYLVVS